MAISKLPRSLVRLKYEQAAQEYLRNLPPEHFMEATPQGRQRAITLASLAVVRGRRQDLHLFNELLVQYPRKRSPRLGQVVPDNMVVRYEGTIEAESSYTLPLQPVGPFWTLEYVSTNNPRKDFEDSLRKYEQELKVPYYLLFVPEAQELTLYRHTGLKYLSVKPNAAGRYALPELEIEVGLLDGWVRYWYQSEMVPLPEELDRQLAAERRRADVAERRAGEEARLRAEADRRAAAAEQAQQALEQQLAALRAQLPQRPQRPTRRKNGG